MINIECDRSSISTFFPERDIEIVQSILFLKSKVTMSMGILILIYIINIILKYYSDQILKIET